MKFTTLTPKITLLFLGCSLLAACISGGGGTEPPTQPPVTAAPPTAVPVEPSPTNTAEPTQPPTATLPPGDFAPLPAAACQQLQGQIAGALEVPFVTTTTPFITVSGRNGVGCMLQASGTQVDFGKSYGDVVGITLQTFQDWQPDPLEAADAANGTLAGLRSGNKFLLVDLLWNPAAEANCPADQPLSQCVLAPEQTLITVTLTAAVDLLAAAGQPQAATPPESSPTPEITPTNPTSFAKDQVIRFDTGPLAIVLEGSVSSGHYDRYVFDVLAGEYLDVQLSSKQQTAGFRILDPQQKPLLNTESGRALWYYAKNAAPGQHAIIIGSIQGVADYTLKVSISQKGAATGTVAPLATATGTPAAGVYAPLPDDECKQIKTRLESALQAGFSKSEGAFSVGAESGLACVLSDTGDGTVFESIAAIVTAMQGVLGDWTEDPAFAADGPTATFIGIRRGSDLMLISIGWQPTPDANCPSDKPIETCDLKPEQKIYTIVIQAARK